MRHWCSVVCALCLAAAAYGQPLITAYRAEQPPRIDGELADGCWLAANVTSPFLSATGRGLPEARTQARVCWDDENLYIAMEAFDRFLEPKLNALDRVRAEETGRDARVFADDCVEVFLHPPGMAYYYHFAANSGTGSIEKTSVDAEWDTEWRCMARRGTGSYVVEMAIPFAALGAGPEGEWRANFARERTAVEEWSTWSGLQGEFHQPDEFGLLCFAESGPALSGIELMSRDREQVLDGTVRGAHAEDVVWEATVSAGDEHESASTEGGGRHTLAVGIPQPAFESGRYLVSYVLRAGDSTFARSAAIPQRVAAAMVYLDLATTNADATVYLNGTPVAVEEETLLRLAQGPNYLAIEASATGDDPAVRPVLTAGDRLVEPLWLVAPETAGEGWRRSLTAEGMQTASAADEGLWAGEQAERARLICMLYAGADQKQLFPPNDTYRFPCDSAQLIRPYVHAPMGLPMDDYRMVVEVPDFLEYVAVEPVGGGNPTVTKAGTFQSDGVRMARYYVTYERVPHEGMEVSLRWGTATDSPAHYQPTIQAGGTEDWHHAEMTVTAYPGVVDVTPVLIKWGDRGVTGTWWVDNVVMHEKGSDEDLIGIGDFEGEVWEGQSAIKPEGPDGSMCAKLVSTPAKADRAQAVWLNGGTVPVEVGRQYVIELDMKCEALGSERAREIVGLLFRAPADAPRQELAMYTYFQSLDGAVTEVPRRSRLVMLPPLKNVRPEGVRITPCYSGQWLYNPTVVQAFADNAWASGMTWVFGFRDNNLYPHLLHRGAHVWWVLGWDEYSARYGRHGGRLTPAVEAFLEQHPEVLAVDFDGNRLEDIVCPTWLLADGQPIMSELERRVLEVLNSYPLDAVDWDLEHAVIDPPTFCTCERCLAAFRRFAGLDAGEPLSARILLEQYPDEWTSFRCAQNAEMAGRLRDIVHRADRPVEFSVYSGFQSERTKRHYGVDWTLLAPHIDFAIAGYGGDFERVRATVEALGDTPLMGAERWYRMHNTDAGPAPDERAYRNRILRQFVQSGCRGVLIWQLASMTGGGFYAVSEAAEIMAQYADYFSEEQRCDDRVTVEGLERFDWAAFENDGRILVLLMNFADEDRTVQVTIDGERSDVALAAYATMTLITEE